MKNDDLDDEYEYENTLLMPLEPKIDLHISQSLDPTLSTIATSTSTLPSLDSTDFVLAKVESRSSVANIIQKQQLPEHSKSQQQQSQSNTTVFGDDDADDDDDHLFGDDFMAQFGKDGELDVDSELRQAKKPLFPRRITLLEATNEDDHNDGDDNLGLERLSISQKHRTLSGGPTKTETTTSTVTPMSNTTITSNLFTRPSFDSNRASLSVVDPMASQLSEELLEMSARQQDSMLEDMIQEDERLRAEEAELDDMLLLQMYEQDMMQQEAQQRQKELLGFDINQKRKYASVSTLEPSSSSSASSSSATASKPQHTTFSTIQEVDQFLKESYKVGESSSTRNNTEQSKKTRLGYASTGSNNSKPAEKSTLPNLQLFSKRQRASGIPKYDYTLPPERGSFIKAKNSSGQVFYLPKKVRVDNDKV
ncbi:hypothetical protein BCR41DRAFT_137726 [Lobosporangium transversale]|uniref:Uncharacterized protein n=1 Tax=Lobosporangium transversale TaxID=64571 RepID=A0A1Y2GH19_9FUNG|nr:hypothetical protein BCR41DRAFT_137726 [Lobosporangium transversale]ORZ09354.1 hypothetical protein BCR41DRAFT_137726 [Lobosporangium transversale]|eukprot:XP_021878807.1 hypothetical protein BCR41DRAFT_137726 [Lobosporangium transversale]